MFKRERHDKPDFFHDSIAGIPMKRENQKEMSYLFLLYTLEEYSEGITGYRLQKIQQIPRSNLLRLLDELERNKWVTTSEHILNGRNQKLFFLTEDGRGKLLELKSTWSPRFERMSDMAPIEEFGPRFPGLLPYKKIFRDLEDVVDKDDFIDYFRGTKSFLAIRKGKFEKRIERIEKSKDLVQYFIDEIENMEEFQPEKIFKLLDEKSQETIE